MLAAEELAAKVECIVHGLGWRSMLRHANVLRCKSYKKELKRERSAKEAFLRCNHKSHRGDSGELAKWRACWLRKRFRLSWRDDYNLIALEEFPQTR